MAQVKCKICGKMLNRDKEGIKVSANRYAHKTCAKQQELKEYKISEEEKQKKIVRRSIHTMAKELFGAAYSRSRIERQIDEMLKEGKSEIGILRSMQYWFEVRQEDVEKAHGGIGIVAYIYGEAQDYWFKKDTYQQKNLNIPTTKKVEHYYVKPTKIKRPRGKWVNLD